MERSTRRKETGTNVRCHRFIQATIPSPSCWASRICAKRPSNGTGLASLFEKNRSNFKAHTMPICKPRGRTCSDHGRNRVVAFARDYHGNHEPYSSTASFFCSCYSLFRKLPWLRLALWHGLCSNCYTFLGHTPHGGVFSFSSTIHIQAQTVSTQNRVLSMPFRAVTAEDDLDDPI